MISVLHIATYDILDGAPRAAYRLHKKLQSLGVDSKMFVGRKFGDDDSVMADEALLSKLMIMARPHLNLLSLAPYRKKNDGVMFSMNFIGRSRSLVRELKHADIVQLNWIGDAFLSVFSIGKIGKPIVWRLPDMWPFTGGCHYSMGCDGYERSCGKCPLLKSRFEIDATRILMNLKRKYFRHGSMTLVAPSRWMMECAKKSSLFRSCEIRHIPTGVDLDVFRPIDRKTARRLLNLPEDRHIILFGAIRGAADPRKGFSHLRSALLGANFRAGSSSSMLLVFGSSGNTLDEFQMPVRFLGKIHDDVALALCYSAADVFVIPSTEDNLPNTVLESLACGTPVVAFDIGGMPDMIEHQKNGYLAAPFEAGELAEGILWVLNARKGRPDFLSENARRKAEKEFDSVLQAEKYQQLYEKILGS